MLKIFILVLVQTLVLSQTSPDPCSFGPCKSTEVCVRKESGFACLDQQSLKMLLSKLPNQVPISRNVGRVSPVQQTIQQQQEQQIALLDRSRDEQRTHTDLPTTDRKALQQQRVLEMVRQREQPNNMHRNSVLPTTDRQPVELPTTSEKETQLKGLGHLRRGKFVSRIAERPVKKPSITELPVTKPTVTELPATQPTFIEAVQRAKQPAKSRLIVNHNKNIGFGRQLDINIPSEPFSVDDVCKGLNSGDQLPYPFDNSKFIICSPSGGSVLNCPPTLKFNMFRNRCDYTDTEPLPACLKNPCKNGGICSDIENYEYECKCPPGFEGARCEKTHDACSSNPCGPRGTCHTFGFSSGLTQYYCLCDNLRSYGLDCERTAVENPCLMSSQEAYYPVNFSPSVFIHCYDNTIHLKACNPPLVWSQEIHGCDRPNIES